MTARRPTLFSSLFLAVLLVSVAAKGGSRRRAVVAPPAATPLSIHFVDVPGGVLESGRIAATDSAAQFTRTVHIRIGESSQPAQSFVTLRAFLEHPDTRAVISVNGVRLRAAPQLIARHLVIGSITTHRIVIEVPESAPEGDLSATIGWEATTE